MSLFSGNLSKLPFFVHGNAQNLRCRFYLANLSKLLFLCPYQNSKFPYTFWPKFIGPYWFLTAVKKCLVFCQKNFRKVVKTSFHLPEETLEAVMFLIEIFLCIIFEVWAEKNLKFVKIFFWSLLIFSEKIFFVFENSKHYCRNLNNNLRTFQTKSSPVFQNCIKHLKPFSWRKKDVRKCINFAFLTLSKIAWRTLGKRFPETFLEFHCTSTLEKLEHVCSNKIIFVFVKTFRFSNTSFRSIDTKISAVDQKCIKRVHGKF